jgi:hypothetical protein
MIAWTRVNRQNACPICGKVDWCLIAQDQTACICPRTEQGAVKHIEGSGYLHFLKDHPTPRPAHRTIRIRQAAEPERPDFAAMALQYETRMTLGLYQRLAEDLGVSLDSLRRLRVGVIDRHRYSFPMSDPGGRIIGIRVRADSGQKWCITGSSTGLFIPLGVTGAGPLLVVEGNTDCAAGLTLGFDCVGCPSAGTGTDMLVTYCRGRHIAIIADNDEPKVDGRRPGIEGAKALAQRLALVCPSLRIILPPENVKDLRGWVRGGLTREQLETILNRTEHISLRVRIS